VSRDGSWTGSEPRIDLDTVRETLTYLQSDMRSSPSLAHVSDALAQVIKEIAAIANRRPREMQDASSNVLPLAAFRPNFVPWSPT